MIQRYLDGQIGLRQIEEWLVPFVPVYASDPKNDDADIVATIELGLAEIADRVTTEDEFRKSLGNAIAGRLLVVDWTTAGPMDHSRYITSGSSNQNVPMPESYIAGTTVVMSNIASFSVITPAATVVTWAQQPADTSP
jgi:hypothetical protein